jgi:hypothetical protein
MGTALRGSVSANRQRSSARRRRGGSQRRALDARGSKSTTIWNGEAGYGVTNRTRRTLEVFHLFDSDVSVIDYFYTSRLPGEPLGGVDHIHLHPSLPRTARVTLQVSF